MKVGLALEGGSRQTIFTAGILDAFLDEGIKFQYVAGVSAGGHAAINFIAKQRERFRFTIMPTKLQQGKKAHFILDGWQKEFHALHYSSAYGVNPFDFKTFFESKVECEFGLTRLDTGRIEFKSERHSEKRLLDLLNASCALPMAFSPANIDGHLYADGTVTDPIPYDRAFENGCEKVVVISTHFPGETVTDFKKYKMLLLPMYKRKYPDYFRALMVRFRRYERKFKEIEKLEREGRLFLMRPETDLCWLFETEKSKLDETYNMGFEYAIRRMDDLKTFLEL